MGGMAPTYVALLRGVNVGGRNKLPMKELATALDNAGYAEVRTYIQSGNVIFTSSRSAAKLPEALSRCILENFGTVTPVVLRSLEEMKAAVKNNPFLKAGAAESELHVLFMADAPAAENVAKLDWHRSPPDEFVVRGKEIYLRLPRGAADSKLTNAYFDSKLATVTTGRNWRTVNALFEMMQT